MSVGLELLLHSMRIDIELFRHHRRDACRPLHPGVALASGQTEDCGDGPCPVDELALDLGETNAALLRLDDFVALRARRKVTSPPGLSPDS
jgi:hypothetical protein